MDYFSEYFNETEKSIASNVLHDKEYSVDYGEKEKLVLYAINQKIFRYPGSLENIISLVPQGSTIVAEASFGSYGTGEEYNNFLRLCEFNNIKLRKVSNRAVKNYCLDNRIPIDYPKDDDEAAAQIIGAIYKTNYFLGHFKPRRFNVEALPEDVERFKVDFMLKNKLRLARSLGYKESKTWLKQHGIPHNIGYYAAYEVAKYLRDIGNKDRKEFDRFMGLYAHAYPSYYRANFHAPSKSALDTYFKNKYGKKGEEHKAKKANKEERKQVLKELRKTSRKIFHLVGAP